MPNPVTHILVPMLIVETYRRYFAKKRFSKWYVFLAGLFGGAPDFDLLYGLFMTGRFDAAYHRHITHSLFIPILLIAAGLLLHALYSRNTLKKKAWKTAYTITYIAALGIASHILLDSFDGLQQLLYPLAWTIHLPDMNLAVNKFLAAMIDGIILFVWLLYDEEFLDDILTFLRLRKKKTKTKTVR